MSKFAKLFKKQQEQRAEQQTTKETPVVEQLPAEPVHELCTKLLKSVDAATQQKMFQWCQQNIGAYRDQWYCYSLHTDLWVLFTTRQDLARFCKQFEIDNDPQTMDRPA